MKISLFSRFLHVSVGIAVITVPSHAMNGAKQPDASTVQAATSSAALSTVSGITVTTMENGAESKPSAEILAVDLTQEAIVSLEKDGAAGNLAAYNAIGWCYEFNADENARDDAKAAVYYQKASGLGVIYDYDPVLRRYAYLSDVKIAEKKIKPCPAGLRNYARFLLSGAGNVRIMPGTALCHLYAAAQAGDDDAWTLLYYCYNNNFGVYGKRAEERAAKKAAEYYEAAVKRLGVVTVAEYEAYLKKYAFGYFLQRCKYCSLDFIRINGEKIPKTDYIELEDGTLVHVQCKKTFDEQKSATAQ
jgi:hypothetical protein